VDSYLEHAPIDLTKQTPERALTNFYGFWKLRYDSKPPELRVSAGSAEIEVREQVVVAVEHCSMMKGAIQKLLTATGAREVHVSEARCQSRSDDCCKWQATWRTVEQ
jgi:predicted hydrocarbon binding protein